MWNEIKRGVLQGSILGPLLFNVFVNDIFMFIEKTEIFNFADDNIIYDCGEDLSNILENLKHDLKILLKWFRINSVQANPGKIYRFDGPSNTLLVYFSFFDFDVVETTFAKNLMKRPPTFMIDIKISYKSLLSHKDLRSRNF